MTTLHEPFIVLDLGLGESVKLQATLTNKWHKKKATRKSRVGRVYRRPEDLLACSKDLKMHNNRQLKNYQGTSQEAVGAQTQGTVAPCHALCRGALWKVVRLRSISVAATASRPYRAPNVRIKTWPTRLTL